jgi:hypothetical protein
LGHAKKWPYGVIKKNKKILREKNALVFFSKKFKLPTSIYNLSSEIWCILEQLQQLQPQANKLVGVLYVFHPNIPAAR